MVCGHRNSSDDISWLGFKRLGAELVEVNVRVMGFSGKIFN